MPSKKSDNPEPQKKGSYNYLRSSIMVKLPDGTQKQVSVYAKSEKELRKKMREKEKEYEEKLISHKYTTFQRWADKWLETYKLNHVSKKTYYDQKSMLKRCFTDTLGGTPLEEITSIHIQDCLNNYMHIGKSQSRINKAYQLINAIFEKAIDLRMLNYNPCRGVTKPKGTAGSRRALTDEEIAVFKEVASTHPKGPLFALILGCGLRPGELRALKWANVDIKKQTIDVIAAIEAGTNNKIKPPKSASGIRTVPIPDWCIPYVERMYFDKDDSGFVFHNTRRQPYTNNLYKRAWKSVMRHMQIAAGAESYRNELISFPVDQSITPYYLRHTYATKLAEAGVDIKTAQYLLGHSDIKMTANIYTHVTAGLIKMAKDKINEYANKQDIREESAKKEKA